MPYTLLPKPQIWAKDNHTVQLWMDYRGAELSGCRSALSKLFSGLSQHDEAIFISRMDELLTVRWRKHGCRVELHALVAQLLCTQGFGML